MNEVLWAIKPHLRRHGQVVDEDLLIDKRVVMNFKAKRKESDPKIRCLPYTSSLF